MKKKENKKLKIGLLLSVKISAIATFVLFIVGIVCALIYFEVSAPFNRDLLWIFIGIFLLLSFIFSSIYRYKYDGNGFCKFVWWASLIIVVLGLIPLIGGIFTS